MHVSMYVQYMCLHEKTYPSTDYDILRKSSAAPAIPVEKNWQAKRRFKAKQLKGLHVFTFYALHLCVANQSRAEQIQQAKKNCKGSEYLMKPLSVCSVYIYIYMCVCICVFVPIYVFPPLMHPTIWAWVQRFFNTIIMLSPSLSKPSTRKGLSNNLSPTALWTTPGGITLPKSLLHAGHVLICSSSTFLSDILTPKPWPKQS